MEERRCRFVDSDVVRLPLSGGEWLDVKSELNAGEARRIFSTLVKEMNAGEVTKLDPERVGLTKLVEYVVGWSLLNKRGQPQAISESAFNALDQDTYAELIAAVDAHDARVETIRAARKNGQGGETPSPAISPSLVGVAGASTGSAP